MNRGLGEDYPYMHQLNFMEMECLRSMCKMITMIRVRNEEVKHRVVLSENISDSGSEGFVAVRTRLSCE